MIIDKQGSRKVSIKHTFQLTPSLLSSSATYWLEIPNELVHQFSKIGLETDFVKQSAGLTAVFTYSSSIVPAATSSRNEKYRITISLMRYGILSECLCSLVVYGHFHRQLEPPLNLVLSIHVYNNIHATSTSYYSNNKAIKHIHFNSSQIQPIHTKLRILLGVPAAWS